MLLYSRRSGHLRPEFWRSLLHPWSTRPTGLSGGFHPSSSSATLPGLSTYQLRPLRSAARTTTISSAAILHIPLQRPTSSSLKRIAEVAVVKHYAKQLSDEVERLQNLLSEMGTNKDAAVQRTPQTSARVTGSKTKGSMSKSTPESVTRYHEVLDTEPNSVLKDNFQTTVLVPDCCRGSITCSGDVQGICVFQNLFELLLGMQFSVDSQTEGPCLSAVHQMSGYTFTLTWLRREDGEGEFRYQVSSLGTLERVALEWMKEDIIFSRSMWPVFFERMSRAIGCR